MLIGSLLNSHIYEDEEAYVLSVLVQSPEIQITKLLVGMLVYLTKKKAVKIIQGLTRTFLLVGSNWVIVNSFANIKCRFEGVSLKHSNMSSRIPAIVEMSNLKIINDYITLSIGGSLGSPIFFMGDLASQAGPVLTPQKFFC